MLPTSDVPSEQSPRQPVWTSDSGRRANCATVSSRCCLARDAIEDIAHLVGHASTAVTEKVYRKELRPVLRAGATAMNTLFDTDEE